MDKYIFRENLKNINNSFYLMNYIFEKEMRNFCSYLYENSFYIKKDLFKIKLKEYKILDDEKLFEKIFFKEEILIPFDYNINISLFGFLKHNDFQYLFINNKEKIIFYLYSIILTYNDIFFELVYDFLVKNLMLLLLNVSYKDFDGDFCKFINTNLYEFPETHYRIIDNYSDKVNEKLELLEIYIEDNETLKILKDLRDLIGF